MLNHHQLTIMRLSTERSTFIPLAAAASGCAAALYALYCLSSTTTNKLKQIEKNVDETTAVSHVHLQVSDLQKSKKFYLDLGFDLISEEGKSMMALFKVPSASSTINPLKKQQVPFLLLEQTSSSSSKPPSQSNNSAADAGYARMCLLTRDYTQELARLESLGYKAIRPPVTDLPGDPKDKNALVTIFAILDPDGTMVEYVSMSGATKVLLGALQIVGVLRFPMWVHININATNYNRSWEACQELGFVMEKDYGKVANNLYKALAIPSPGIAKAVSLIKIPKTQFMVDLIEWEDPKTTIIKTRTFDPICIAITVNDVSFKLEELLTSTDSDESGGDIKQQGWTLEAAPTCVEFPGPMKRAIKCTVKGPDGVLVDLVSYPEHFLVQKRSRLTDWSSKTKTTKAILVTGCDSGFGRSLAIQMAGLGFHVIAACLTMEGAQFLDSIATIVVADLATEKGLRKVLDVVRSQVVAKEDMELWAIVNNAGMHMPGHVEWLPPDAFKQVMAVNFHAPVHLIHELTPLLRQSKGRIVNVSSVCGIFAAPSNSSYSASKFALEALSDSLRIEHKPFGVDVVIVEPTTMKTKLATAWWNDWNNNYQAADPEKKQWHSEVWRDAMLATFQPQQEEIAEDPLITVAAMLNALVMENPPARIMTGVGAKTYYRLSCLPVKIRDALMLAIYPDPVAVMVDKK